MITTGVNGWEQDSGLYGTDYGAVAQWTANTYTVGYDETEKIPDGRVMVQQHANQISPLQTMVTQKRLCFCWMGKKIEMQRQPLIHQSDNYMEEPIELQLYAMQEKLPMKSVSANGASGSKNQKILHMERTIGFSYYLSACRLYLYPVGVKIQMPSNRNIRTDRRSIHSVF